MYYIAIVVILIALIYYIPAVIPLIVIAPFALLFTGQAAGGAKTKSERPHIQNSLVRYTLNEFKQLGGFTTLGESVCRAAIYLESQAKIGAPILLKSVTGETVPWLKYKTVDLEIDGLDEKHKLAFEYDGPQHYSWEEWKKMGRRGTRFASHHVLDFYRSRFYDRWKTALCRERDIKLIRVSTWTSFDAMRAVIAHALAHDFTENRPRDDAVVIDEFTEIDIRNSVNYPQLTVSASGISAGNIKLTLATDVWQPHPYTGDNLYTRHFRDELTAFAHAVHEYLIELMPSGKPEDRPEIEKKLCARFDEELEKLDAVHPAQLADVRRELHRVATEVSEQLTQ